MRGESQLQRRALSVQILPAREVLTCCEGSVKQDFGSFPFPLELGKSWRKPDGLPRLGENRSPVGKTRAGIPSPSTAIFLFFLNFGFIAAAAKAKPSNLAASAFL